MLSRPMPGLRHTALVSDRLWTMRRTRGYYGHGEFVRIPVHMLGGLPYLTYRPPTQQAGMNTGVL